MSVDYGKLRDKWLLQVEKLKTLQAYQEDLTLTGKTEKDVDTLTHFIFYTLLHPKVWSFEHKMYWRAHAISFLFGYGYDNRWAMEINVYRVTVRADQVIIEDCSSTTTREYTLPRDLKSARREVNGLLLGKWGWEDDLIDNDENNNVVGE